MYANLTHDELKLIAMMATTLKAASFEVADGQPWLSAEDAVEDAVTIWAATRKHAPRLFTEANESSRFQLDGNEELALVSR